MPRSRQRGAALIITLLFVVLLTFLIVAYFSRTVLERQIAASSSAQQRADSLAQGALSLVVGDLKQEIVSGSLPGSQYTVDGVAVCLPATAVNSQPAYAGKTSSSSDPTPNLIKRSAFQSPFFSGAGFQAALPASRLASSLSTYQSGSSGLGSITPERWNKPLLLPLAKPGTAGDNTPAPGFEPPDWIFVGPSGPVVLSAPRSDILGRYAYAIYNIGSLLDINVAGASAALDLSSAKYSDRAVRAGRQSLPLANLLAIPGITSDAIEDIVAAWRNKASSASSASYKEFLDVSGPEAGFRKVAPGDHTFLGRRDLLDFWSKKGLDREALQYLTTFSREVAAPSYVPSPGRKRVGDSGVANDGASVRSATTGRDDEFNPALPNLRWPQDVTLYAGTDQEATLKKGDPFLYRRFPLSKLDLLSQSNPDAEEVMLFFGLKRGTDGSWVYDHGGGGKIFTLPELLAGIKAGSIDPREPDFFELLQAGILQGSLGRDSGLTNPQAKSAIKTVMFADQNTYLQILRIGANIIDQWDEDSYPTEISLPGVPQPVYGVENLPYLSKVYQYVGSMPDKTRVGGWYLFEMWNPHKAPAASLPDVPREFRVGAEGSALVRARLYYTENTTTKTIEQSPVARSFSPGDAYVKFRSDTVDFSDPKTLEEATGAEVEQANGAENADGKVRGIFVGDLPGTPQRAGVDESKQGNDSKGVWPDPAMSFPVQYLHPRYGWKTYDVMRQLVNTQNITHSTPMSFLAEYHLNPVYYYVRPDPRSDRFVSLSNYADTGDINKVKQEKSKNLSQRPTTGYWNYLTASFQTPARDSGFLQEGSTNDQNWLMGAVEVNGSRPPGTIMTSGSGEPANRTRYMDADGVFRKGDAAYSVYDRNEGHPLFHVAKAGNDDSRPVILNRPFRSVGELGYAFRDTPWKSLDFFTADSADAALLDLFTISETPGVVAGTVNANSQNKPVLKALLQGALITESANPTAGGDDVISAAVAEKIADQIIAQSRATPFVNRSDLVTRVADALGSGTETFDSLKTSRIKARRESALRALANVTSTRTWNLMIDLIAQSGRFPDAATSLDQFQPTAEKRYWLHLAIDRYTGEVIERHLESVYE